LQKAQEVWRKNFGGVWRNYDGNYGGISEGHYNGCKVSLTFFVRYDYYREFIFASTPYSVNGSPFFRNKMDHRLCFTHCGVIWVYCGGDRPGHDGRTFNTSQ
jgi:hypothetical protein